MQEYVQVILGAALILIGFLLFAAILQNLRIRRRIKKSENELLDNYQTLQAAYDAVSQEKEELAAHCEELSKSKERMKKTAYTDYLTCLPNRLGYSEYIESELKQLKKGETLAILDLDIDNFKLINESYGHSYGDDTLREVARRLTRLSLERGAYLARIGGDEFSIVLKDFSCKEELEAQVQQIINYLKEPYFIGEREFLLTVSMGVVLAPADGMNSQVLTRNMDAAKFFAKTNGRDNYVFYDESLSKTLAEKLELQSEIRRAIEEKAFEVYFQPQIDLATEQIIGFEALVRWNHPDRGVIVPAEFIPVAEESGLIVPLGEYILRESCKRLKKWQDEGYVKQVLAVNLSARQFKDRDFMEKVVKIIRETEINPKQLELEITESMALDDLDYAIQTLRELKELGVSFALDDFGTGYSSLSYLKRLPVNQLKIDKSFMDRVLEDHSDRKIVETIIALAQALNLVVIAEGVERAEQAEFLKSVSCDKAQGYLYSKPVRENDLKAFLQV